MAEPGSFRRVFGAPLIIAAITVVGLCAALLGGAPWAPVSWIALAAPLAVIVVKLRR